MDICCIRSTRISTKHGRRTDLISIQPLGSSSLLSGRSQRHFHNATGTDVASSRIKSSVLSEGILGSSVPSATSRGNWGFDTAVSDVARLGVAPHATGSGLHDTILNTVGENIVPIPFTSLPQQTRQQRENIGARLNRSFRNRGSNVLSVSSNSTARTVNTTSSFRRRRIISSLGEGAGTGNSGGGRAGGLSTSMGSLTVPGQTLFTGSPGMGGISGALGSVHYLPEEMNGIFSGGQGQSRSGMGVIGDAFGPRRTGLSGQDGSLPGRSGAFLPELGLRRMMDSSITNGGVRNGFGATRTNGIVDWNGFIDGRPGFSSGGDSVFGTSVPISDFRGTGMNGFTDRVGSMSGESGIISSGSTQFMTPASNGVMGEGARIGLETGMLSGMVPGLGKGIGGIHLNSVGATQSGRPLYVLDAQTLALLLQRTDTRSGAGRSATTLQGEEVPEMEHEEPIHSTTSNTLSRGEPRQQLSIGSGGSIQFDGKGTSIEFVSGGAGGHNNGIGQTGAIFGSGSKEGGHQLRISGGGNGQGDQSLVIEAGTLGSKGIMIGGPGSTLDIGGSSISVPGNATLIIGKSNG
ncbi:hypothetical protein CHS0354_009503 [Potamilus streckersoni]|uniref:Uncharacterized protein n=1 Tax=Potamilus streckersoni TaxID=2493646 RepID=A0AAE0RVX8_9BIVA|nr:hypothetical protein CHS0354_009503 [Potamilus streckersoni]